MKERVKFCTAISKEEEQRARTRRFDRWAVHAPIVAQVSSGGVSSGPKRGEMCHFFFFLLHSMPPSLQTMCKHTSPSLGADDGTDRFRGQTPRTESEDSFEVPDTRADMDEAKSIDHGPLQQRRTQTPLYKSRHEKALRLVWPTNQLLILLPPWALSFHSSELHGLPQTCLNCFYCCYIGG